MWNSAVKRIIFESVQKYNGSELELLHTPQIKQIGGRAGRFRTAAQVEGEALVDTPDQATQNLGLITTLEEPDLRVVQRAMRSDAEPILSAGLFPPTNILMDFAAYFPPPTRFSYILMRLHEISIVQSRYKLCNIRDQVAIADIIHSVQNLSIKDRIVFCAAPFQARENESQKMMVAFAKCVADNESGALLDISELKIDVLDEKITTERSYLNRLELLHKGLILYLWLSYRFAGVFVSQDMAFYVKSLVEERIEKVLSEFSASTQIQSRIKKMREAALQRIKDMQASDDAEDVVDSKIHDSDASNQSYLPDPGVPETVSNDHPETSKSLQLAILSDNLKLKASISPS